MKDFFLLHDKSSPNKYNVPKPNDYDYIVYINTSPFTNEIEIDGKKYCPHKIDQKMFNWNWNSDPKTDNIDLITHENGLVASYEKIIDTDLELWKKII